LRKPISLLSLSQNIARIYRAGRAEIPKYRNLTLELSTTCDSDGKITYKRNAMTTVVIGKITPRSMNQFRHAMMTLVGQNRYAIMGWEAMEVTDPVF